MGCLITSVIWRTTSSLLRNLPSKRGARSRASIWKKWWGRIVIFSNDGPAEMGTDGAILGLGEDLDLILTVTDLGRWPVRIMESSLVDSVVFEMGFLVLVIATPTRLNRWVCFIQALFLVDQLLPLPLRSLTNRNERFVDWPSWGFGFWRVLCQWNIMGFYWKLKNKN